MFHEKNTIYFRTLLMSGLLLFYSIANSQQLITPSIVSPELHAVISPTNSISLKWSAVPSANTYRIQVINEKDGDFDTSLDDKQCDNCLINNTTSSTSLPINTLKSGKYIWRIRAGNSQLPQNYPSSQWAESGFAIRLPLTELKYPINETIATGTPRLDWSEVSQADTYRIQLSEEKVFNTTADGQTCYNCIINEKISESQYIIPNNTLANEHVYYWRVRAGTNIPDSSPLAIPDSGFTNVVYFNVKVAGQPTSPIENTESENLPSTLGIPQVDWKEPVADGAEVSGSIIYADGIVTNPGGIKKVIAIFEDISGKKYEGEVARYNSVTQESFGIPLQPIKEKFSENSIILIKLGIINGSDQRIDNIATRTFKWCTTLPCPPMVAPQPTPTTPVSPPAQPTVPTTPEPTSPEASQIINPTTPSNNNAPVLISSGVSQVKIAKKASLQFVSSWKDQENNFIVNIKVRYRRDGAWLGIDHNWKEYFLDYVPGSNPPSFSKTIQVDEPEGPYEFEFQASDVEQLGGTILHTTAWQGLGNFSVIAVTNNQPPVLNITKLPIIVKKCQPVSITFQVSDPDKNLREVQVDWSGKGTNVTGHLVGDGQTITISSPVGTNAACPSELTNKPDTTLLTWTATAYDTLDAKSKMAKAGYYINKIPVAVTNRPNVGGSQSVSVCSKNGQCVIGDPVNPATGSQIMDLTVLKVNGVLPISFSLSYDSAILDGNGIVGKAWSSNLSNTRLEQTPDNDVIIHWSENQYNTFFLQEDGSYFSNDSRTHFDNLIKNADGSFTLTRQSKAIYDFNAAGQLQVIRNPQDQRLIFEYDSANKLSKVSEPISGVFLSYVYNAAGLLESVSDSLGRKVSLAYNSAGYLETITDAAQQTVTYSYDSAGRILKAVNSANDVLFVNTYDANGKVVTQDDSNPNNQLLRFAYSQDANGNDVTTVTQRDGSIRALTYNGAYQLLSVKDELNNTSGIVYDEFTGLPLESVNAKGAKTQLKYDDKGNLVSGINAKGIATQIMYDALDNPLSIIDGLGNKDSFVYNDKQLLVSATNALNQTTTLTYNNDNQVATITSPKGAVIQREYLKGLLSKVTDAEGQTKTLTRDAAGRVIQITDALGKSSELGWDAVNRLISITDALGRVTKLAYNARDKITSITDPKGNVTTFDYDSNGNRVKVTNALGEITRFEYDAEDRLIKIIDALNQESQLVRDATGRVIKTIDPLGNSDEVQFDALGNVIKSIDALGQTVATLEYDILDNVTKATDALGNSASVEYDSLDRAVKSIDPLNRATEYQYDVLSRLEKSVDALKGQSSQTFDADGELVGFKDPNQHETRSAFDKSGRMIEQTTTTGGKVSYRYDARDLLTELKNARGQVRTVEYDAVGRVTQWTDEISSRAYQYDDNDNVLSVVDSVAGKVSFTYDKLDRVITYTDAQENKLSYTYDVIGNLTALTYPDNKQVKYAYDARGSLISVTDWANRVTRYSYDANGQVIKEERPNNTVLTKRHDAAGRLIEAQDLDSTGTAVVSFSYLYDAAGNIIEEQMSPEPDISAVQSMSMEYGIGNSLSKVDAQATPFDLDGNLLQAPLNGTLTDFAFNARNELIKAANLDYGYDALGYRDVVKESGKTTRYVLNPVPALHQALIKIAPDSTKTFYVYGLGLIGEETNGKYLSYHFDYRGSTVALTANDGQVVNRFAYEPYGGLLGREALLQGTPFLFNGRYGVMTDPNGLYQMRARYYHPELRRFINQDPVFLGTLDDSQSLNRFAYVNGKPVNAIDPFGLYGVGDFWNDTKSTASWTENKIANGSQWVSEKTHNIGQVNVPFVGNVNIGTGMGKTYDFLVNDAVQGCNDGDYWSCVEFAPIGKIAKVKKLLPPLNNKQQEAFDKLKTYLGEGVQVKTNKSGDTVFVSADGNKKFRADLINPAPHKDPHFHVEERTENKWVKSGPTYPASSSSSGYKYKFELKGIIHLPWHQQSLSTGNGSGNP